MNLCEKKEKVFIAALNQLEMDHIFEKIDIDCKGAIVYTGGQKIEEDVCSIFIILDDSLSNSVAFIIAKVEKEKKEKVLNLINSLNKKYELCKFYINDEDDLCAQFSYIADMEDFSPELMLSLLIHELTLIQEKIYPQFKKVIED